MKKTIKITVACMLFLFIMPKAYCGDPEDLLGVSLDFNKKEITITVVSSGCTGISDFQFAMKNDTLTIFRKKRDECKMLESTASFTYSFKEAGIDANRPFRIINKFIGNPFIANIRPQIKAQ